MQTAYNLWWNFALAIFLFGVGALQLAIFAARLAAQFK